jgi:hypothetical protein
MPQRVVECIYATPDPNYEENQRYKYKYIREKSIFDHLTFASV